MNKRISLLCVAIMAMFLITNCTKEKLGTNFNLIGTTVLDSTINECSGLAVFDNKLWTINDSGGGEILFQINESGSIIKTHNINNAINLDWECLASDNEYLYIGDIGNNFGFRQDLKIYQLNNDLSINQEFNVVYNDQFNFSNRLSHNFDAEAMIVDQGKLWVFTKNHQNDSSNIYYKILTEDSNLNKIGEIQTNGLVTDAYYDSVEDQTYLLIYIIDGAKFVCTLNIYSGLSSNELILNKSYLLPITEQAEAFTKVESNEFLIGTEREGINKGGKLYRIRIEE
jgi:hypothetical protein